MSTNEVLDLQLLITAAGAVLDDSDIFTKNQRVEIFNKLKQLAERKLSELER